MPKSHYPFPLFFKAIKAPAMPPLVQKIMWVRRIKNVLACDCHSHAPREIQDGRYTVFYLLLDLHNIY